MKSKNLVQLGLFVLFHIFFCCLKKAGKEDIVENIVHGNSFSRAVANEMKKGAYYTDTEMCRRIGKLLRFPEDGEVTVLEPSVGDASAVRAVLGENRTLCKTPLFAVELDKAAAAGVKRTLTEDDVLLNADFLRGVTITPGTIGYCFANPPYGTDDFSKRRYEELFLKLIYTHLKKDGICTYVIPYYLFTREESFVMALMTRFKMLALYRFDDKVYEQFQQVCVVLRRRPKMDYSFGKTAYAAFLESFPKAEELPYLPIEPTEDEKVDVPIAERKDIKVFAPVLFDSDAARKFVKKNSLIGLIGRKLFGASYTANELTRPPIPPKKDLLYLCAIAGAGQGTCGNEEDGDLHLQRGVVKTVIDREIRQGEKEGTAVCVEKSRAAVVLTTIENDGTIRRLE